MQLGDYVLEAGGLGGGLGLQALFGDGLEALAEGVVLVLGCLELGADLVEDVVQLVSQLDQSVDDLGRADLLLVDQGLQEGGQAGDLIDNRGLFLGLDGEVKALGDGVALVLSAHWRPRAVVDLRAGEDRTTVVFVGGPQPCAVSLHYFNINFDVRLPLYTEN